MDRKQIIRMAREAGITINPPSWWGYTEHYHFAGFEQPFERFAALVAAAEREACAKVCDEREEIFQKYYTKGLPALCAEAIRARGNT
jgi:hypothetical protein